MAENEIKVPIEFDARKLEQSLGKIEKSIDRFATTTERKLSKTSLAFTSFIGNIASNIATSAFEKIRNSASGFLDGVIEEAQSAESTMIRLQSALIASGENTKAVIEDFNKFASSIQQTTKFGDDLVKDQIAIAKAFGLSNEATKLLITSATDLSAITGKDLPDSVETLLKSLNGEAKALKILGPEFAGLTEAQLKSGEAIDLIAKKFGDASENELNTFTGAILSLKNAYGDMQEEVGNALVKNQGFANVINSVKSFMEKLTITLANSDAIANALTATIGFLVDNLSAFLRGVDLLIRFSRNAYEVMGLLSNSFGIAIGYVIKFTAYISNLVSEFLGFGKVFGGFIDKTNKVLDTFKEKASKNISILKEKPKETVFGVASDHVKQLAIDIEKGISKPLKKADALNTSVKKFSDSYTRVSTNKELEKNLTDQNKILNQQLELYKKINEEIKVGASNVLTGIFGKTETQRALEVELKKPNLTAQQRQETQNALSQSKQNSMIGGIAGIGQSMLQGAQGASNILASGVSMMADAFLPGLGQVAGPIAQALFAGPEAVKGLIDGFYQAIPVIVENLIEGLMQAFESILENIPKLIDRLVELVPRLISAIAEKLPELVTRFSLLMPQVAISFAESLIEQAPNIAMAIAKAIPQAIGGGVKGAGKFLKFAEGGIVGGNSMTGDQLVARVNSGEMVLNRSQQANLFKKINSNGPDLLDAIKMLSSSMATQPIIVQVDGREIARVVRDQKKLGFVL